MDLQVISSSTGYHFPRYLLLPASVCKRFSSFTGRWPHWCHNGFRHRFFPTGDRLADHLEKSSIFGQSFSLIRRSLCPSLLGVVYEPTLIFHFSPLVRLLHRRFPRYRRYYFLSRSPCRHFYGGLDLPYSLYSRSSSMARPHHAPVARHGSRHWYRSLHCVRHLHLHVHYNS